MNGFSDKLRELRGKRSIQEASEHIGISRVALTRYETGERKPNIEILHKICKYYNVTSDYLIGIDNNLSDYENLKKENKQLKETISQIKQILELER